MGTQKLNKSDKASRAELWNGDGRRVWSVNTAMEKIKDVEDMEN